MQWYYASNGQRLGPISEAEFEQRVREGVIGADTLVWKQGMANWLPYGQIAPAGSLPAPAVGLAGDEMETCAVSGRRYPKREMIQYEGKWISAEHRDLYFQRLREGVAGPGEVVYAGFWLRFVAKFLDGLILGVPLMIVYMVVSLRLNGEMGSSDAESAEFIVRMLAMQGVFFVINISVGLLYNWFFIRKYNATPGKLALGLRLVRADRTPLSTGRIIGRFFAEILSQMILYIGYIMAGFDSEKRALHDHLCDTRVIKK